MLQRLVEATLPGAGANHKDQLRLLPFKANSDTFFVMFTMFCNKKIDPDKLVLKLVHDGGSKSSCELLFFHGVNSSGEKAFTNANGELWIKNLLPPELLGGQISIWSYTYRNDLFCINSNSPNYPIQDQAEVLFEEIGVRQAATKNFILVGHSYGGLLIKQFLILLEEREKLDFLRRVKGVVFYGTPHRGTISWLVQRICCLFRCRTTSFRILEKDHPDLKKLHDKFMKLMEKWGFSAFSFYEDDKLHQMMIVPKWSAVHDPNDYSTSMRAVGRNHKDMCKHTSSDESTFIKFVSVVKGMLGNESMVTDDAETCSIPLGALPVCVSPHSAISDPVEELNSSPSIESRSSTPESICGNNFVRGSDIKQTLQRQRSFPGTPVESYDSPSAGRMTTHDAGAETPTALYSPEDDRAATRTPSTKSLAGKIGRNAFSPTDTHCKSLGWEFRRVATHLAATNNTRTAKLCDSDDVRSKTSDHTKIDDTGTLAWERENV
eukprot:gene15196-17400_t